MEKKSGKNINKPYERTANRVFSKGEIKVKFTELDKAFCEEYVRNGGNKVKAAEFVGYKGTIQNKTRSANSILKNMEAQKYISKLNEMMLSQLFLDRNKVITTTWKLYEQLVKKNSGMAAVKALELLSKLLKLLDPEGKVSLNIESGDNPVVINYIKPGEEIKTGSTYTKMDDNDYTFE